VLFYLTDLDKEIANKLEKIVLVTNFMGKNFEFFA